MRKTFLFSTMIFLLAGCNKDKFASTPHLKYESVNTKILVPGEVITFTLSFTDAEGDFPGSLNVEKFEPNCVDSRSSDLYPLPVFPTGKNQSGQILVSYGYNLSADSPPPILAPQCDRNDTCVFRFVLTDKAMHHSDTAVSETIVILK